MKHIFILALLCPFLSNCQPLSLKGKIINEQSQPVPAATITVKRTAATAIANDRGEFTISNLLIDDTLLISAVGYVPETVIYDYTLQDGGPLTIMLKRKISMLDETVIIAYGSTTKRLATSSISKITAAEIATQPVSNPLSALQGRIPGLVITQLNGLPGSGFTVQLRGRNSIQQGTDPLYIIDGVPFASDNLSQRSGSLNASSPFSSIDPSDIESIEVLKDADATAIYGSRGANGVILITTKKGKSGLPSVDLNYYTSYGSITRSTPFLNTRQYLQMRREAFSNDGATPTLSNAPDLLAWDSLRYTNMSNELIGGTAHTSNINTRFSGGNASTAFTLGLGYNRQTTVFPSSLADELFTSHLSLQHSALNKKLLLNISLAYASENNRLPLNDLTQYINYSPNIPPLYDSIGKLNWSYNNTQFTNPLAIMLQGFNGKTDRLTANTVIAYRILGSLSFKTSIGYNYLSFAEYTSTPVVSQSPFLNPKGAASFANNGTRSWIIEPQLEHHLALPKSTLQTLVGASAQSTQNNLDVLTGSGYINDALLKSIAGAASFTASNSYSQYKYEALFARINFNYSSKYIINLTGRYDGSSRFGSGKQFAPFGAFGLAWIFSNENFVAKNLSFLSYGKLRGSYGITGNDQVGNYQYLDSWGNTLYPFQGIASIRPLRLFNDDYSWERNRKLEAAVELGFLKDRFLLTANWFRNRSNNQLITYSLPSQTGFTSIIRNFPGLVQNSGLEFEFTSFNIQNKNFTWQTTFNITSYKNKLISFPGLETSSYANTYRIGQPLSIRLGYHYTGINTQTGVYTFEDVNGDGSYNSLDYKILGTTDPRYYGGLGNNFKFKNLEASFFFRFINQLGRHIVYSSSSAPGLMFNRPLMVLDRWQEPGDISQFQKYTASTTSAAAQAANRMAQSDAVLTGASFIRLQNVSLSYALLPAWLTKIKMTSCRLYLQGQNLVTITRFKGMDPENQSATSLPPLRILAAGIQLTF